MPTNWESVPTCDYCGGFAQYKFFKDLLCKDCWQEATMDVLQQVDKL